METVNAWDEYLRAMLSEMAKAMLRRLDGIREDDCLWDVEMILRV